MMFLAVAVFFRSFDNVAGNSILRFLVDSEVRQIPLIEDAAKVSFRLEPRDGNKPQLDGATITGNDPKKALVDAQKYFLSLGYSEAENGALFVKSGREIRLNETSGGSITITKYSWY